MRWKLNYTLSKLIFPFIIIFSGTAAGFGQTPVANFTGSPLAGCSPLIINFQDQSTGNPTTWSWDFGNGNTSSLQNPVSSYFTPGSYTVSLTVTNVNGSNTLTRTQYISVYESPAVNFTGNNTSGCFPLPVQFTDLSTAGAGNTNVSWQWDFGNGLTSTLQNPSVIYPAAGTFSVTLKVTNDKGCTRTFTRPNYITVAPGVDAGFTHTQPTVCLPPADITFTNTTTGPAVLSYLWDFGDGNTSVLQNPTHTYITGGSFIVTLIATSSAGCTDTARNTLPIIIGGTITSFTVSSNICVNAPVNFTNTSSPVPVSVLWNFGDGGTSGLVNPSHTYTTTGSFTVWLHNTYSGCLDSTSVTITVNARPAANFTSVDTVKCQPPLTSNFQDLTVGAVGWQWNFGDGGTSAIQNPTHTYNNYGSYTVTLIVTNAAGCTDTIVKTNFIKIRRAIITIPSLPTNGCIPFTITPVANINSVDAVTSYLWNFGDGITSTLQNPAHTYIAQGTYTVSLIITTASGCTDTLTIGSAVRVGTNPFVDFTASPTTQCAFQPVQFTDLSAPVDQWIWDFGDGATSTTQNPAHLYSTPGTFTVRLIAFNNGCPDTMTRTNYIGILPPVALFTYSANCAIITVFQFTDQSTGPLTWDWDFGDGGPHSFIQNPLHTFPALGVYNVILTVTNGGCTHKDTIIVHAIDSNPDFTVSQTTGCKPRLINFTAINISPPDISNYFWDFGDGQQQNIAVGTVGHTYTSFGTFTVMLVTTDINGCRDTVTKINYIRINGPTSNFTATNVAGCAGLTTTFNDLSTTDGVNSIISWQWDYGDGSVQTYSGPPFQHTYNVPGTYNVKLKVTDAAGCSDSLSLPALVTVTDPVPNFVSADTLTCPGATVSFNNTSTGAGLTSNWDFGDGGVSSITSPTHVYAATGFFNVKLRIQDMYGCADSLTRNLYIRVDSPRANFTISDSVSSCIPLEVQFTNTSTYFSSVYWDFGTGGSSTIINPAHYYTTPGTYTVKLVITSPGGCKDSTTNTITLFDTAGSTITYLPLGGCKPLTATFNGFSPGPMSGYIWDFGDGTSQVTATPTVTHIFNTFGDFVPKLILQDPGGCFIPVTGIDTVHVIGATAKFGIDKNLLCDSGPVSFIDSTTFNDPVINYNWLFGDGGSSGLQNPVHQYTSPGIYDISLDILTQNGCRDTLSKPAIIKVIQRPLIDIAGDSVICVNQSLLHSGIFLQPDTSVVAWSWSFPNGNISALKNPLAQIYSTVGNFTVRAIATNSSGCRDTSTQNIIINPLPIVNMPGQITIQNGFPVTIPAIYSPNVINWAWTPAAGLSCTNCATPDAGPKFRTIYRVDFSDVNGCQNTGFIEVTVFCMNGNLFIPNTFSPNGDGSNDRFYPRGVGIDRVKVLRIFNRWGEVVFERNNFPINDPSSGWDGTYKGKKPLADVYVYQAEVFCENGKLIILNGNIALIL